MVDTPRDGRAWADVANEQQPWAACSVRVASDAVGRIRFVRLSPAMACKRAQMLADELEGVVTIYQAQGGRQSAVAVATVSRKVGWRFMGKWQDAAGAFRREAMKTDGLPWIGALSPA